MGDDPQQVPGISLFRLDRKNLLVDPLGGLKSPRLMVLNGDR
jgi:hypothetical protein